MPETNIPKIVGTRQYDLFKRIPGNRKLSDEHTRNIVHEIRRINLLSCQPGIVNEHMELIDGQHRLAAAKQMGLTFYYQVIPGLGVQDMVRLNNTSKNWVAPNYVNLYVENGFDTYIELKEFKEEHNISYSTAARILGKVGSTIITSTKFRVGNFEVTEDLEKAERVVAAYKEIRKYVNGTASNGKPLASAVYKADSYLKERGHSIQELVVAVKTSNNKLSAWARTAEFIAEFQRILYKNGIKVPLYHI